MSKKVTHFPTSEMSTLDPDPGDVGFISVISIVVQPSPSRPQEPDIELLVQISHRPKHKMHQFEGSCASIK